MSPACSPKIHSLFTDKVGRDVARALARFKLPEPVRSRKSQIGRAPPRGGGNPGRSIERKQRDRHRLEPLIRNAVETEKVHALLVMDEAESRQLSVLLAKHNIRVHEVLRVRQAVGLLEQHGKVDVILTDLSSQEIEFEQFLRHLQGSHRLKRIPVIGCAETLDRDRVLWAAGLGIHDFLLRPCEEDVLMRKIGQVIDAGIGSILVVDDEPIIRDLLAHIVEREGFRVLVAGNGREAMDVMAKQRISMVITDLMMPEMNGLELLVEVKDRFPGTPVILVTGRRTEAAREEAISAGADGYITKPFKNLEIAQKIESLLSA